MRLTAAVVATMLTEMDAKQTEDSQARERERVPVEPCPQCGVPMMAVRGSKEAVCSNCGFKDSCCY